MTLSMRRPTPAERERITRCRKQFFEVERLGLMLEQAQTSLSARLNDGMPRGKNLPYGVDDRLIRAERTRREYEAAQERYRGSRAKQRLICQRAGGRAAPRRFEHDGRRMEAQA